MKTLDAARRARTDLIKQLERGELPAGESVQLREARERFVQAARDGKALNKRGQRYKRTAIADVEECLRVHVEPKFGSRRLADIRRGQVQALVDELTPTLSGSQVRAIVNSLRSLYRWAQDREIVSHDPAALVRLPAMNATPIERVASPAEFKVLLAALPLDVAVPYALAGYAMGRRAQITRLTWAEVDLEIGAIEWGVEWEARKYQASQRVVPIVAPLWTMLKRRKLEQGRPEDGLVCSPLAGWGSSGRLNTGWLAIRARRTWEQAGLRPITLQEARHTAATWLDAAGVTPKVASVLMGHATPAHQPGAASITLARYTHALPEDIEHARKQLDAYLTERQRTETVGR
jgi:integrase